MSSPPTQRYNKFTFLLKHSGTLAQHCPCVLRAAQAGPRGWMKGSIKLSAANSSLNCDEVVLLLLIIFSFPLGKYGSMKYGKVPATLSGVIPWIIMLLLLPLYHAITFKSV